MLLATIFEEHCDSLKSIFRLLHNEKRAVHNITVYCEERYAEKMCIRDRMNPTRTGGRIRKILTGMESAFRYLMKTEYRKSGQETENNGNGF